MLLPGIVVVWNAHLLWHRPMAWLPGCGVKITPCMCNLYFISFPFEVDDCTNGPRNPGQPQSPVLNNHSVFCFFFFLPCWNACANCVWSSHACCYVHICLCDGQPIYWHFISFWFFQHNDNQINQIVLTMFSQSPSHLFLSRIEKKNRIVSDDKRIRTNFKIK